MGPPPLSYARRLRLAEALLRADADPGGGSRVVCSLDEVPYFAESRVREGMGLRPGDEPVSYDKKERERERERERESDLAPCI